MVKCFYSPDAAETIVSPTDIVVTEMCCEAKESPLDLARVARVINLMFC
jgi:hypothetical protein